MIYERRGLSGKWIVLEQVAYVPKYIPLFVAFELEGHYIRSTITAEPNIGPFESLLAAQLALVILAEAMYDNL